MPEKVKIYDSLRLPTPINCAVVGVIDESGERFRSNSWITFNLSPKCDLSEAKIAKLEGLLYNLKRAGQMRCHIPKYGLLVNSDWVATFCFQCNNIHVSCSGKIFGVEFDGKCKDGRALLKFFESSPNGALA